MLRGFGRCGLLLLLAHGRASSPPRPLSALQIDARAQCAKARRCGDIRSPQADALTTPEEVAYHLCRSSPVGGTAARTTRSTCEEEEG